MRLNVLVTYLFRLLVLLARRMGARLGYSPLPSPPQGNKLPKAQN